MRANMAIAADLDESRSVRRLRWLPFRKRALPTGLNVTDMSGQAQLLTQRQGQSTTQYNPGSNDPVNDFTGSFGPGQPMPVQGPDLTSAPGERGAWAWDYNAGRNLIIRPRGEEQINTFEMCRSLAETYDIARICIEYVKDQISSTPYDIQSVAVVEGQRATTRPDPQTVGPIKEFLRRPDGIHAFEQWARIALEEMLVVDALAIYPKRTYGGTLQGLEIVDGTTIKPLLDYSGRLSEPPNWAYQQIIKGRPWNGWTRDELIYAPLNPRANTAYGQSGVERFVIAINTALRKELFELAYFKDGNTPDALIGFGMGTANPAQVAAFQEWVDTRLRGDDANRRGITAIPIPTGSAGQSRMDIYEFRKPIWDRDLEQYFVQIACAALYTTPSEMGFTLEVNRSTGQSQENAQERRLRPLFSHLAAIITEWVVRGEFHQPDLEFRWLVQRPVEDQLVLAQVDQIHLNTGQRTENELRERDGLDPYPAGAGDQPFIVAQNQVLMIADVAALSAKLAAPTPAPEPAKPLASDQTAAKEPAADGDASEVPPKGEAASMRGGDSQPALKGERLAELKKFETFLRTRRPGNRRAFEPQQLSAEWVRAVEAMPPVERAVAIARERQ